MGELVGLLVRDAKSKVLEMDGKPAAMIVVTKRAVEPTQRVWIVIMIAAEDSRWSQCKSDEANKHTINGEAAAKYSDPTWAILLGASYRMYRIA